MKIILKVIGLFLLMQLFAGEVMGQADFTYDVKSKMFTGELPFDENFSILVKGLDPTVEYVEITIWDTSNALQVQKKIRRKNKSQAKKSGTGKSGPGLTSKIVLNHHLIPTPLKEHSTNLVESADKKSQECKISFASKIDPNRSLLFDFKYGSYKSLTAAEKTTIEQSVNGSSLLNNVQEQLINTTTETSSDFTKLGEKFRIEFIDAVSKILIRINPKYKLVVPDDRTINAQVQIASIETALKRIANQSAELIKIVEDLKEESQFSNLAVDLKKRKIKKYIKAFPIDKSTIERELNDWVAKKYNADDTLAEDIKEQAIDDFNTTIDAALSRIDLEQKILLEELIKDVIVPFTKSFDGINQTYHKDAKKNEKRYIYIDGGYGYAWNRTHFAQAGASIHLRPIKPYIPLRHYSGLDRILNHFSLLLGANLSGEIADQRRRGIIAENRSILTGIGIRIVPGFNINIGGMLYYKNQSPLDNDRILGAVPFISASINFNASPAWKEIYK